MDLNEAMRLAYEYRTLLTVLFLVAVLGGCIFWVSWTSGKREVELDAFAKRRGLRRITKEESAALNTALRFPEEKPDSPLHFPADIPLFLWGHQSHLAHALQDPREDAQAFVYDFRSSMTKSGNGLQSDQTVAHFRSRELDLPAFALRPKKIWSRSVEAKGHREIAPPQGFPEDYTLKAKDSDAARMLFDIGLLAAAARSPECCLEGAGDTLIIYAPDRRLAGDLLDVFLADARRIFDRLKG